jgi:hypothetical protein
MWWNGIGHPTYTGANWNIASTATSYTVTGIPATDTFDVYLIAKTPAFHTWPVSTGTYVHVTATTI